MMTLTINLSPEEEAQLRDRAIQAGQAAETVGAALLKQILQPAAPPAKRETTDTPMTDAEFDAYWGPFIGVIHSGGAAMSENCGEKFTEGMVEKHRQGHL